MKIQLDTKAKTIKVEEQVNLGEFIKQIKKILPDWENYKLETGTIITYWSNPYVIRDYIQPYNWPWNPCIYWGSGTQNFEAQNNIYNLELGNN